MVDSTHVMDLETAWRKFYDGRESRPSAQDEARAHEIARAVGAIEFKILKNYVSDVGNMMHINVGFLASKVEVPYASWDETYEEVGFTWRLRFSNFGASGGSPKETETPKLPWCWRCSEDGHTHAECPRG
jgi:hypothetical protein